MWLEPSYGYEGYKFQPDREFRDVDFTQRHATGDFDGSLPALYHTEVESKPRNEPA